MHSEKLIKIAVLRAAIRNADSGWNDNPPRKWRAGFTRKSRFRMDHHEIQAARKAERQRKKRK